MLSCFKLCGQNAREYYSADLKTESQRSKRTCRKSCDRGASGAPDHTQLSRPPRLLSKQVPTEGELSSLRKHPPHLEDSGLSFTCWASLRLIIKMEHPPPPTPASPSVSLSCGVEEKAVRSLLPGKSLVRVSDWRLLIGCREYSYMTCRNQIKCGEEARKSKKGC